MTKEQELMGFLESKVFQPVLSSKAASSKLKAGVRMTMVRMNERDATGMVQYFWSAIVGTERSVGFAHMMKQEGFVRFEEVIDDFRIRFNDKWLNS